MGKTDFIDRLSKALKAEVPRDANRGSWIGRRADELNIGEERLAAYLHGENQCPGSVLLSLFDKFGPEFEAKVRGSAPVLSATEHEQAIAEIHDIAARFADRTEVK